MAGTNSSTASTTTSEKSSLKRDSNDIGWDYGELIDPSNKDKWKCKLCPHKGSGGVNRLKQHIAQVKGNTRICPNASREDILRCKEALDLVDAKKKKKVSDEIELRSEVHRSIVVHDDDDNVECLGGSTMPNKLGAIDRFFPIDPDSTMDKSRKRQQSLNETLFKDRTNQVHQFLARWVYESGIPFHAVDNDAFKRLMEAVGTFGPGYRPPSQYELREPLLKAEVERTKALMKKQEEEWTLNGCSIMTDAWSDRKRRSIMNLCVNCKEGTTFLSSKEASDQSHTGPYIFEYVDKCVEDIGQEKVVQVVTDNASANMAAKDLMKVKRPNIFWTSCATHTINLMLQGIGNLKNFKGVIEKAKSFTIYVYAHHKTLDLLRKFTRQRDIVRPGVTRFASAFLTLQSLVNKKTEILSMVTSDEWNATKHSKTPKGKAAVAIAHSIAFWTGVSVCLLVFAPLVKVLRLVDGDRKPTMGFVYGEILNAKEEIKKVFKNNETHYRPILDIIELKARDRLDSPLHLASYILNPYYSYNNKDIFNDEVVMMGFLTCVEAMLPLELHHIVINLEWPKFMKKEGLFGRVIAMNGCKTNDENYDPVSWWSIYGNGVPNLQRMAKRILSLTSSASGCERNWSTFEGIHTKKRNRLDTQRLNNLVYVQFNAKIINKKKKENVKDVDVLLAKKATMAQGWIVEGGDDDVNEDGEPIEVDGNHELGDLDIEPRRSSRLQQVRELNEDDFESDEEEEVDEMDYDFESDNDEVREIYGEEEFVMS